MSRKAGQSVSDARLPRGLRLVDDSVPEKATMHTAAALPRDAARLAPPSTLRADLHPLWDEITGSLHASGLLAAADTTMVALLVQELELYTIAVGTARSEGVILYSEKGTPVANPAFSIASTHARVIEGLCKTMGLTFVARAAMDAPESVKAKAGNPFAV